MMIAASVDSGMYLPSPPVADEDGHDRARAHTPVSCVRDPADSATAVRDAEALTGKPWNSPAATFATPSAMISWFASTCSPRCAARLRDNVVVSASVTNAMPAAGHEQRRDVVRGSRRGTSGPGNPEGTGPTTRPRAR